MMNKKAGTAVGDWISAILLVLFTLIVLVFTLKIVVPSLGIGQQIYVTAETKDTNSWVFTIPFLNTEVDGKKVSDIIVIAYTNNDYSYLMEKTNEIIWQAYGREVSWEIYLDGNVVIENKAEEELSKIKFEHIAALPLPYEARQINFRLRVYEPYDALNAASYWGGQLD